MVQCVNRIKCNGYTAQYGLNFLLLLLLLFISLAWYISVKSTRMCLFRPRATITHITHVTHCYTALLYPPLGIPQALPCATMYINAITSL